MNGKMFIGIYFTKIFQQQIFVLTIKRGVVEHRKKHETMQGPI